MVGKILIVLLLFSFSQDKIDTYINYIDTNKDLVSIERKVDMPSCDGTSLIEYYLQDNLVKSILYIGKSNNNLEIKFYFKKQHIIFIDYNSYSFKYDDEANIFRDSIFLSLNKRYYIENNVAIDSIVSSFKHDHITRSEDIYSKELLSIFSDLKFEEE